MSNLDTAKRALMPKKDFTITFEERETYTVTITAIDKDEAIDKAQEVFNNGNACADGNTRSDIINIEENESPIHR